MSFNSRIGRRRF